LSWYTGSGGVFDYEGSRMVTELDGNVANYPILKRHVHGPGAELFSKPGEGAPLLGPSR
jgi:hypothetical protein